MLEARAHRNVVHIACVADGVLVSSGVELWLVNAPPPLFSCPVRSWIASGQISLLLYFATYPGIPVSFATTAGWVSTCDEERTRTLDVLGLEMGRKITFSVRKTL